MADGIVIVPPDSTGKNIATQEITRPSGTVVELQQISSTDSATGLPKPNDPMGRPLLAQDDILAQILIELRLISYLLLNGFNSDLTRRDDLSALRVDSSIVTESGLNIL